MEKWRKKSIFALCSFQRSIKKMFAFSIMTEQNRQRGNEKKSDTQNILFSLLFQNLMDDVHARVVVVG